jgi:methionyl-tRNA synthetase
METKPLYLTTTLPYVNSDPHIGFAFEIVNTDAVARYHRLIGRKVFFNTGTDEHGQKISDKAKDVGQDPQVYVDRYAAKFRELGTLLNLSVDAFIRTTDTKHVHAAQELWRRCVTKGDIYKKSYTGLYCVGCELFKKDSDLVEGKCPVHTNLTPQTIEEENYFFALSKYQDKLIAYLSKEGVVLPEWRRQEALEFVKGGLEDFSISREAKRMSWGIPVPEDDTQVIYVWFDALTNYISTLDWPHGENFQIFWTDGETVQVAGKDQVRFQSIMWQAMLISADVTTTDKIVYHGFITSGGQKMSKSLGNVISPAEMVARYGTDATRYLLLRHIHPFEDTDVTWERMDEWYNANLANGIGNLASRIMKLAETHLVNVPDIPEDTIPDSFKDAMERFAVNEAADIVWKHIGALDERIQLEQPFKVIKEDIERGRNMIATLVIELYTVGRMLNPLMPATSAAIKAAVREIKKPENLFVRLESKTV